MIITRLKGGLGNQMFQYAAGLALSMHHNTRLLVDGSFLYETANNTSITPRKYELGCFNIEDDSIRNKSIRRIRKILFSGYYIRLQKYLHFSLPWKYVFEKSFVYDSTVSESAGNIILDGYWQSELYFKKYSNEIRSVFTVRQPLSDKTLNLLNELKNSITVSVHIRRGDLISNPAAAAMHGLCPDTYYMEALQIIKSTAPDVKVIVFSDEPEYVRTNMQFLNPWLIVDWNQDRNHEDLLLMQHCSHHIIANSSFSWWGAWLNPSGSKQVIAPAKWFLSDDLDTSTLIPSGWRKI